jgi:hypothetical protein
MCSAKMFTETLIKSGQGSHIAKPDIRDAYKLIPSPKSQWNCYGFSWLGMNFFDSTTVFGSAAAPASFDPLPETVVNIVCSMTNTPKKWVKRQLDDVPIVSPKGSNFTENFYFTYKKICRQLGIPLATECPNHDKAFGPSTFGTVLGLRFDSEEMKWSISEEKKDSLLSAIDLFLGKRTCSLNEIQKLHGKLSDFAQACQFLKGFRYNIVALLGKFEEKGPGEKLITAATKRDLQIWKNVASEAGDGFPLGDLFGSPPLFPVSFVTDAAGAAWEWTEKGRVNRSLPGDRGAAAVGHANGQPTAVARLTWPFRFLTKAKSSNGNFFGSKSATLEAVGLLLPFLAFPAELAGHHVLLEVDNLSVVFAWDKKHSKVDPETSLLIRCLHVLESFLHCKIYVRHLRRMSNRMAILADSLSRQATISAEVANSTESLPTEWPRGALHSWLKSPGLDWDLPLKLVNDVKAKLENHP